MSSGDSFQCSSMDGDDQIDGLSPMSMWRRNRRRKDFSDGEDYKCDKEEDYKSNKEEDYESDKEGEYKPEKEEDHKTVINIGSLSATPPAPVLVSAVRVNVSLRNKRRGAFISTRERFPGTLLLIGIQLLIFVTGILLVIGITRSQKPEYKVLSGNPTDKLERKDS
jgi:hypothetical protein